MTNRRLGIYVIHDRDGMVDDYVIYFLKELRKAFTGLAVVCNGFMRPEALKILRSYAECVHVRDNAGYDLAAFKEALEKIYGWEKIGEYDELLLANDSFYGPFCPLEQICDEMREKHLDFWGITGQYPMENTMGSGYEEEELPYHIQSYFIYVGRRMLHSRSFYEFWHELKPADSFREAVVNFELRFTKYFTSLGYTCGTYVDCKVFDSGDAKKNYTTIMQSPYEMIAQHRCPVLKRKCFTQEYDGVLSYSIGEDLPKVLEYIDSRTPYNVGMIWKNLIRLCDPKVLKNALHLEFILPWEALNRSAELPAGKKIAVIAHINYPELIDVCFEYLRNIPKDVDLYINTKSEENERRISRLLSEGNFGNCQVNLIGDRGREISGLLVGRGDILMKYDYLCFVHDKRTSGNGGPAKIGRTYMYMLWENTLKSREFIINVIDLLEKNPYLGVLSPPSPYHDGYFGNLGSEWTTCFERTKKLSEELGLSCTMSREYAPVALTTTFWCKTKALRALFEHGYGYGDFPEEPMSLDGTLNHAIERIFAYVAQHEGYATGILMNSEFASLQLSNYYYMLCGLLDLERANARGLTFRECIEVSVASLLNFCGQFKNVYIYGTGDYGTRMTRTLTRQGVDFKGYLVSDGHKVCEVYMGKPVNELTDIEASDSDGVIVALDKHNQEEALPGIRLKGWKNLYLV